jgi:hypothetical protein
MEYHSNNNTKGDGSAAVNAASGSKNRLSNWADSSH